MICKLTILYFAFVWVTAQCHKNHNLTTRLSSSSGVEGSRLGIYCGTPTTIYAHPYQVAIYIDGIFFCSGTIVGQSWIVTLADCAYGYALSRIRIVVGASDGYLGMWYEVKQVVIHPQYGYNEFDYNYACMQASGLFQWSGNVQPIPIAHSGPAVYSNLVVAGWGAKNTNWYMTEGTMSWLPQSTCASVYSGFGFVWTDRMACTYNKGCTTPCDGDWGDAFVQNGVFYGMFIGGASYGFCTAYACPSIVANITAATSWISGITGAQIQRV